MPGGLRFGSGKVRLDVIVSQMIIWKHRGTLSLTIVAQERDDEVVAESKEVHGVAEEIRHPVVACNQWHEKELQDVEEDP